MKCQYCGQELDGTASHLCQGMQQNLFGWQHQNAQFQQQRNNPQIFGSIAEVLERIEKKLDELISKK